jgi:hypothetical protein
MVLKYDQMIAKYSGDLPDFASALFKIYIHNTYSNLSSFSYIFSYSLAITTERFASIYEDHLTGQGLNKTRYNLLLKGNP